MNSQRRWLGPLWTCVVGRARVAPLAGGRQVGERVHVVGLGVDDQPALLEAEVAPGDPAASRTNEFAPSAPITQRARTVRDLLGRLEPPALVLLVAADGERRPVAVVDELLGDPAAVDGTPLIGARAVERRLELRLEEQVVGLPSGARRRCGVSVIIASPSAPNQRYSGSGIISPATRRRGRGPAAAA